MAAYRRWPTRYAGYINGVFALAVHSDNELLLYRDASGLQNLYWCRIGTDSLAFATDLNALLALREVPHRLARRSLHEYLRFLDIAAPHTWFDDIHALQAGHELRWSPRGLEIAHAAAADRSGTHAVANFEEAVSALDALLQHSVGACMEKVQRPAAFLSGGIDSSLIGAIAGRKRLDLTAITVGFDDAILDEAPLALRIAQHLGLRHEVLRFSHQEYVGAFERLARQLEQPMADPATPATVLAFDHCRKHFDAVLDGTGADEAVGAMPPRHVRLAVEYGSLLPPALRRGLVRGMRAVPGVADYTPILDFEHPADTMIRWRGFTRPEIEAICGEPVSFERTQFYRTFERFPRHAHYERYSALLDAMPSDRLSQSALITGLSVRYPFFDGATNRYLRQLRTEWRYLPGQPKRILRALLARYVPAHIWDLPKHGFDFPLQQFLAADDHALVRRYLEAGRWLDRGLLRADLVRQYARRFMAGEQRLAFRVWALVVLGAWLENHDELH